MTDSSIADIARVRGVLIAAARARRAMSYAELLGELSPRFMRPGRAFRGRDLAG